MNVHTTLNTAHNRENQSLARQKYGPATLPGATASPFQHVRWCGPLQSLATDPAAQSERLAQLTHPCYIVRRQGELALTSEGTLTGEGSNASALEVIGVLPPLSVEHLGDPHFRAAHKVDYAYASGAMANGIASEALVIAMGKARLLSSFGAAGLLPARIEQAIDQIQQALPNGPYAFNLIHSPSEEALERAAVDLYLRRGITTVEASAFLDLTPHIVRYRVAGLQVDAQQRVVCTNKVIAKVSRREVARKFLQPAPERLLAELVQQGQISQQQATLAAHVPMADDITVEADSGGHTDNRPLVSLFPSIVALRDELQARYQYATPVRVGAAGGIGTPTAVLAAFSMGAAYVVTGSINQACVEAGASAHTKQLLAQADMADVMMAPAADMFEMGVKLQVLKRGTFFPMRAQKLYEVYQRYESIEAIPEAERAKLERQLFHRDLDAIWAETVSYFSERDPQQIERAVANPKRKMALLFRWYLGLSSRWSNVGEAGREMDYQIWCGPAMGAFNDWTRGTALAEPSNRRVATVAQQLMVGAALLYRQQQLQMFVAQTAHSNSDKVSGNQS